MTVLPSFEQATVSLSPDAYLRYLRGVQLDEVLLEAVDANANRAVVAETETFKLDIQRGYRVDEAGTGLPELLLDYVIRGLSQRRQALRIKATYRLRLSGEEDLPIEFFAIYARTSANHQVWPFMRELAHSLTARMGIPVLTLPIRVLSDEVSAQEQRPETPQPMRES